LENIASSDGSRSAWVFALNHALSDQKSVNTMVSDLLTVLDVRADNPTASSNSYSGTKSNSSSTDSSGSNESTGVDDRSKKGLKTHNRHSYTLRPSIESVVAPEPPNIGTILWALYQLGNSLTSPRVLSQRWRQALKLQPELLSPSTSMSLHANCRATFTRTFTLSEDITKKFIAACSRQKVTVTHALSASVLVLTSFLLQDCLLDSSSPPADNGSGGSGNISDVKDVWLRFLLSVSLRPFASLSYNGTENTIDSLLPRINRRDNDWAQNTVACAAGALDYNICVPSSLADAFFVALSAPLRPLTPEESATYWSHARTCQRISHRLINECSFVPESVRLFGIGMSLPGVDILQAVELEANNPTTLGRGYSCGVSNAGIADFRGNSSSSSTSDSGPSSGTSTNYGRKGNLQVDRAFFGVSHGRNGVSALLSCMTVHGRLNSCLQFTTPLTSSVEAERCVNLLVSFLSRLAQS
ncbi:unnamed protein product, partial [Sphagnum compactum]